MDIRVSKVRVVANEGLFLALLSSVYHQIVKVTMNGAAMHKALNAK